uniref:Uncharacterized protein n=1 Tax=Kuenenia stuttgartiensis TaxID=174633 RepID=Q1PWR5_KUEST|nr:unknown protein [Candidatus Kuenenia stuttgartiensis]
MEKQKCSFPSSADWVKWTILSYFTTGILHFNGKTALNMVENRHNARSCPHF